VIINPFDLRSALLAKHAQHVVLIHFPIALFIVGAVFDAAAERTHNQRLEIVAYYNLVVAGFAVIPAFLSGIVAWRLALEGAPLKGTLLVHLLGGITLTISMLFVACVHLRGQRRRLSLPKWRLPVEAFVLVLLGLTAHVGGFLSGVNG
jgi:uncharacterized membrane protein